jgi:tRNA nucleotidyltransferase (CCA-adding enzyme)
VKHSLDEALSSWLPKGALYSVGGRVRDEVRAEIEGATEVTKDLDYVVVGLSQDELIARLQPHGRVDLVGAAFAIVKFSSELGNADVALPRRDVSTGHGHRDFEIVAAPDVTLEEDLGRRDFRMNMLARALPGGDIVDPYHGIDDIRARRIDITRAQTFEEDPLRMLRAAQFAARFRYAVTPETIRAMCRSAELAGTISAERICDEFLKLNAANRPSIGFTLMAETGVLRAIWPELLEGDGVTQNRWHRFDVWRHALATLDAAPPNRPLVRLGALLHDVGKPRMKVGSHFYRHENVGEEMARAMLARLRFPAETTETVSRLVRHHMYLADAELSPPTIRRFIRRVGPDLLEQLFLLRHADIAGSGLPDRGGNEAFEARVRDVLAERPAMTVRDLAISGEEVIELLVDGGILPPGSRGGPEVGRVLQRLLDEVTEHPQYNRSDQLTRLARDLIHETFRP